MQRRQADQPPRLRRRPSGRRPLGFSLIEVSVAVLALAVLSAMGFNALTNIRKRSAYANGANDFLTALKRARTDAFSESVPVVLVVQPSTGRYWRIADVQSDFVLASFDPAVPVPTTQTKTTDRLLGSGQLEAPASFGPTTGYGSALPAPWALVPASNACTFCVSGIGSITFQQDGTAAFSGTQPAGGSVSITSSESSNSRTYAVLALTGAINVFEK